MADYTTGDSNTGPKPGGPSNGSTGRGGVDLPGNPASQHGHGHGSQAADSGADGLIHIIGRQWHMVVLCTIAMLLLAVLYLMLTKPTYTSISTIRVKPLDPGSMTNSTSDNPALADTDFLDTECVVIKSNAVLALAMDEIKDLESLRGVAHPMDYVKAHLNADMAKKGQAIDVSFDSKNQRDADLIVDAVVRAYKAYESQSWKTRADDVLNTLTEGTKGQQQQLLAYQIEMRKLEMQAGYGLDIDPSKSPLHQRVVSLQQEKEKAELEVVRAKSAYEEASRAILGDDAKLKAVDEQLQRAKYFSEPEALLKKFQDELGVQQTLLADDSRQYLPNHPRILADQARVDQLIVAMVVAAKQWEDAAVAHFEAIDKSLDEANKAELAAADTQRQYVQLQLAVDQLKRGQEEVDNEVSKLDRFKGAGALNISVLNPAAVDPENVKPARNRTMAIGLVLGLITGLGFACVRDWTDDRLRSQQAIRQAAGAPVLGSIPTITTAYTAADRGQIVHHDPFGVAAESYRTLRTALQFGLPPSTKTLLITSPVSGDGKSTFVSNLGIAMAQASKRVLIIDADLRAPMQHRLFGLKDRIGLSTVLAGGDTMAQAIQRTEIEGLDLLPCGPTPTNPAELLNSDAFLDQLNELADKYDLVILDSPPVTAVADARILAASADASLLVIRLESSTRKQTEAARDGLRSVGGRLIGVAVNGVARAGHFGGASGYYPHGDLAEPIVKSRRRPSFSETESRIDPAARA